MGFNWSEDIAQKDFIDNEDLLEIENIVSSIGQDVISSKPNLPTGTPNCASNNPTTGLFWGPRGEENEIQELRYDVIARNLDYIRENNWCRGHYSGDYGVQRTTDESFDYTTKESTDETSDELTHCTTEVTSDDNNEDVNVNDYYKT